ncbi:MAG: HlyD family secretion protein [Candidatus Obscuribacterales bacterium]|nr:HlyD family secretion protein [Candidatus Obscuribacterales bacterium]
MKCSQITKHQPKSSSAPPLEVIRRSEAVPETPPLEAEPKPNRKLYLRLALGLVAVALLGLGGFYGKQSFDHLISHEETDDAYVTGHLHQVSSRVQGTVETVLVDDNEHVRKGQVLVTLDPRDFEVKVNQALASLKQAERRANAARTSIAFQETTARGQDTDARGSIDSAMAAISKSEASVREAKAGIEKAKSDLVAREAEVERSSRDYKRYIALEKEGAVTTMERDGARRDYQVAVANRDAARNAITEATGRLDQAKESVLSGKAALTRAQGQIELARASTVQTRVSEHQYETDMAAVAAASASLKEAELNLSYTKIVAPAAGRVGKKTVEEGHRIEPGQPLLTVVSDDAWVVANYKETQIKAMHPGQRVAIKIDSLPEHQFIGRVESFAPASGASFALLPSDNATGNFTKIVQRVPVKILFEPASIAGFEDRIVPGLSVVTSVNIKGTIPVQHVAALRQ